MDRSFIHALGHEGRGTTITHAMLALGRNLALTVIAEGLEAAEQEAHLCETGCSQCHAVTKEVSPSVEGS